MRWVVTLFLAMSWATSSPFQQSLQLDDVQVRHEFGQWIEFQAQANSGLDFTQMHLILSPGSGGNEVVLPAEIEDGNRVIAVYDLSTQDWIRPFLEVTYRYRGLTASGDTLESEPLTFSYTDNRFTWQSLSPDPTLAIYWYEGDLEYGQEIANAAQFGRGRFRELTTFGADQSVRLYVYPSTQALQAALSFGGALQIAGHAAGPDGLAWAAVPPGPGQTQTINEAIPHELAHVLLYQSLGESYTRLPAWLNEGIASAVELGGNPNFPRYLEEAYSRDSLLSLSTLCNPFPTEQAAFTLAYAESDSFVRYLLEEYGPTGLATITQSYAYGASCEDGPQPFTGRALSQLEADWLRVRFGASDISISLGAVQGWLLIALLIGIGPLVAIVQRIRQGTG
ncbi:MAG: hypothetical protein EPO32_02650 [Anaerolineae bacterium]|nr:MAG: hypothetical protein EPO32_02650 [Anaerolineae bacterium]